MAGKMVESVSAYLGDRLKAEGGWAVPTSIAAQQCRICGLTAVSYGDPPADPAVEGKSVDGHWAAVVAALADHVREAHGG